MKPTVDPPEILNAPPSEGPIAFPVFFDRFRTPIEIQSLTHYPLVGLVIELKLWP